MTSSQESTPLLPPSFSDNRSRPTTSSEVGGTSAQGQYYFVDKPSSTYQMGASSGGNDSGEVDFEEAPKGSSQEDFEPRNIIASVAAATGGATPQRPTVNISRNDSNQINTTRSSWWSWIFGTSNDNSSRPAQNSMPKQQQQHSRVVRMRKAPVKVEPKVFFANERTFLAWMHLSILLAGASMTILAFGDARTSNNDDHGDDDVVAFGQLYGVILLPVAVSFILYSLYQYNRRSIMIRFRHPGPYEDTVGPVVLGTLLMLSIVAQFALKLYDLTRQ